MAIFSIANGYQLPHHPVSSVNTSQITVLQTLSVNVTSGGTNAYLPYPPLYGGIAPPPTVLDTPTWSTYNIPATAITTSYFAVETIQYTANPYIYVPGPVMDCVTDLPHDGSQGYSWFADSDNPIPTNLAGLAQNMGSNSGSNSPSWVEDWYQIEGDGFGNNPYLIRAGTVAPRQATSGHWNVNGSGTWSTGGNWDVGVAPSQNPQDTAVFGTVLTSGTATVTLDSSCSLSSVGFSTTGGASYVISPSNGSTLTLANTGGAAATISNSGGNHTIAVPITLGSNLSVAATPGSTLTVSGAIGEINPGTTLSVSGGGTLILSASNTYTGSTNINSGTMKLAGAYANNIASSPTVAVNTGATLDVTGLSGGAITLASGQTLAGCGAVVGGVIAVNGSHVSPGVGTLTASSLTLNSGSVLDYQFGSSGYNSLINVTNLGGLTINGGGINLYNQGSTSAFAKPGTYTLMNYVAPLGGSGADGSESAAIYELFLRRIRSRTTVTIGPFTPPAAPR